MIVVDVNAVVAALLPGPDGNVIENVWELDKQWVAPTLWRSEFVSAIWQKLTVGQVDPRTAAELFGHLDEIVWRSMEVDPRAVLELAIASRHSPYDCEYVLLAQSLGVELLTFDRRLRELFPRIARSPYEWLDRRRADP